jgi:hypothetical protein
LEREVKEQGSPESETKEDMDLRSEAETTMSCKSEVKAWIRWAGWSSQARARSAELSPQWKSACEEIKKQRRK